MVFGVSEDTEVEIHERIDEVAPFVTPDTKDIIRSTSICE